MENGIISIVIKTKTKQIYIFKSIKISKLKIYINKYSLSQHKYFQDRYQYVNTLNH